MTHPARHVSVSIARPWQQVWAHAHDARRLPTWASGLAGSIREHDGAWLADSPMGEVRIEMAPRNAHGVLDHDVTLPDGRRFHNPMRVLANGDGCEVVFTLYRHEGVADADFERDAATIAADLATLKRLLEAVPAALPAPSPNDRCIDYLELVVADIGRAKAFWSAAFGWTYKDYAPVYTEFSDGRLTGGFTTLGERRGSGGALVVLYADDLDGALQRVSAAGGTITAPPFDFPGGSRFEFACPDGYPFAVWRKSAG